MKKLTLLPLVLYGTLSLAADAQGKKDENPIYPDRSKTLNSDKTIVNDASRGVEKRSFGDIEYQQSCPQQVGDAYDLVPDSAWNMAEIGIQLKPEQKPRPQPQFYSHYSCIRPTERVQ